MKHPKTGIVLSLLAFLPYLCVICSGTLRDARAEEKACIRVGYNVQSVNYGPIMVAHEKGFFGNTGVEIKLVPLKSGKEVRQCLAAGQLDMGAACPTDFFPLVAAGAPVVIIAPLTVSNTTVFVRPDSKIETFADFEGKRIEGGRGGHSEFVFRRALKKEGVDVSEIEFIHVGNIYRCMALMVKQVIDVVPMSFYGAHDLQKYGAVVHREWQEKGYADHYWLNKVIGINSDFLRNRTVEVELFIDAMIHTQRYMIDNREESAEIIAQHIKAGSQGAKEFQAAEILQIWDSGVHYTLWYDPRIFTELSNTLVETGMLKREIPPDEIYDPRFEHKLRSAHIEIYE